jgi:hypothetical protein
MTEENKRYNYFALGGDELASTISGATGVISNAINSAQLNDTSQLKSDIQNQGNVINKASSNDDLLSEWAGRNEIQNVSLKDLTGGAGSAVSGLLSGAGTGASAGAAFGPIGSGIGAGVGALLSGVGSLFKRGKAVKTKHKLNDQIAKANEKNLLSFENKAATIEGMNDLNAAANFNAYGGSLASDFQDINNGLKFINEGGTHEQNPFEGVQIGVDREGTPNLVEEGEVVWNNYVFSNRLKVPKAVRNKYKLRGVDELSFADAVKEIQKESEERPLDPISKNYLDTVLSSLAQYQEQIRAKKQMRQAKANMAAYGGKFGNIYDGNNPDGQLMTTDIIAPVFNNPEIPRLSKIAPFSAYGQTIGNGLLTSGQLKNYNKAFNNYAETKDTDNPKTYKTWMRYAPAFGAAIGLATTALKKPDYRNANAVLDAARSAGNYMPVHYEPLGNYLAESPLDVQYPLNQLNAQAAASRRAIVNQSNGNRATATAGILASDYNTSGKIGELYRGAKEYNAKDRETVATFNRGTNQYNSEASLKAQMANQDAFSKSRSSYLSGVLSAMNMRDTIDANRSNALSANFTNLFKSIGNIGVDNMNRNDRDMLIRAGLVGTLSEKPQDWSDSRWNAYKKVIEGTGYRNGGKLKKRRDTLTY